jgi:hypothetical protein
MDVAPQCGRLPGHPGKPAASADAPHLSLLGPPRRCRTCSSCAISSSCCRRRALRAGGRAASVRTSQASGRGGGGGRAPAPPRVPRWGANPPLAPLPRAQAQTAYFVAVVMNKVIAALMSKTRKLSVFTQGVMSNKCGLRPCARASEAASRACPYAGPRLLTRVGPPAACARLLASPAFLDRLWALDLRAPPGSCCSALAWRPASPSSSPMFRR